MRRAILFSFDALLGSMLILAALLVILYHPVRPLTMTQTGHYAQDALTALNAIPVGELDDPWVAQLILDGTIQDPGISVLEQIGVFWATNRSALAQNLTTLVLDGLLSPRVGLRLRMEDDELFLKEGASSSEARHVVAARRMITGIQKGEALEGSTSTAYLKRIESKKSFLVAYLGGFVGQGDVTVELGPFPDDFAPEKVTSITLKLDTIEDFDLTINGDACRLLTSDGTLMTVQAWDLSDCNASLVPGINNVTFLSLGDVADAYIAGGLLKVAYTTESFQEEEFTNLVRYAFPAIDGIINLYDGISAPGIITDWYLNLSFKSNYTVFMRLGNETLFSSPGSDATQHILLEAHNLSWAPTTIPLRLGTTNFSNVTMVTAGQPADTAIVTDVSGSMNECGEWYTGMTCRYRCRWWFFSNWKQCVYPGSCSDEECGACSPGWTDDSYSTPNATICARTQMEIAKEADKVAVGIILNASGNRVGLVSYNDRVRNTMELTTDSAALTTQIDGYTASGGTCICCGINRAKNMVKDSLSKRFMIVMSDGDANYRCDDFDDYVGTSDATNGPQSAIDAGQNACTNHNITLFTIGFGSSMSEQGRSTLQQAACNSSLYYDATNVSALEEIYRNISEQILLIANFTAQTLVINGTFVESSLYSGSSLLLNYTPLADPPRQNEILVKWETPQFGNCTAQLSIPDGIRVSEALTTSYSGPYWGAFLDVNGVEVFNLSRYSEDYVAVGDPFRIAIPSSLLNGTDTLRLVIEDNNGNATNCSGNNTVFFQGFVNSTVPRSDVLSKAEGCAWEIEFDDGTFLNVSVPAAYAGTKNCSYTNASQSYDPRDAYDYGVYNLLANLDFDDDGRVFVNIRADDLEIIVTVVTKVPYLWGPSYARLEAWQ